MDRELEELLDDDFLKDFMEARMKEMMERTQNTTKRFGSVIQLESGEGFLDCSEREDEKVTVVVMVYDPRVEGCEAMAGCLEVLAPQYLHIKWCKILSTAPGFSSHLSKQFKTTALPALLIYRAGEICSSSLHSTISSLGLICRSAARQLPQTDRPAGRGFLCQRPGVFPGGTRTDPEQGRYTIHHHVVSSITMIYHPSSLDNTNTLKCTN